MNLVDGIIFLILAWGAFRGFSRGLIAANNRPSIFCWSSVGRLGSFNILLMSLPMGDWVGSLISSALYPFLSNQSFKSLHCVVLPAPSIPSIQIYIESNI